MKKSELRQIIREEIKKLKEDSRQLKSGFYFHSLKAGDKVKHNKTGKILTLTTIYSIFYQPK